MQIKEIMSKEVITVKRSTTLKELLEMFTNFHMFPLIPVVEEDKHIVGIISFRNIISAFRSRQEEILKSVPFLDEEEEDVFKAEFNEEIGSLVVAEDIMEKKFVSMREDTTLEEAYKLMKLHLKEEFPVVDRLGRLSGMVGIFDIVRQVFREKGVIK